MSSPLPEPPALPAPRPARAGGADSGARWAAAVAIAGAAVAIGLAWKGQQEYASLSQSAGGRLADLGVEVAA